MVAFGDTGSTQQTSDRVTTRFKLARQIFNTPARSGQCDILIAKLWLVTWSCFRDFDTLLRNSESVQQTGGRTKMDAGFCVEALQEAMQLYGKPEMFNTNQGSQFTGFEWTNTLSEAGVKISMDGLGSLDRQSLHRAASAVSEIRMHLSSRL